MSQSTSKTSSNNESDNQEPDEMEEPNTQTTTQAPHTNRRRPLSQTRSYHSIFSSVRGSVRNGGSRSNSHTSSTHTKDKEDEEKPTNSPTEEETGANEATEDKNPESSNNASPQTQEHSKYSSDTKESKPNNSDSVPKTSEDKRPPWTPRTSSIVDISRLRRPSSRSHGSRSRMRSEDTSSSSLNQESAAKRKDLTAVSYPEGKNSYNQITVTDSMPSVVSPQENRPEPVKESESTSSISSSPTSSSSASSSSSSVSSPSSSLPSSSGTRRFSSGGSGAKYPNGRRVGISTRSQRLQTGKHKPDSSASASSQSTLPTGTSTDNHDTTEEHDTNQKNTKLNTEELPVPRENHDNEEETEDSTSHSSSRTNPSTTGRSSSFSLPNRSSRIITSSRRQDGRIPWSRSASSVGAGRPIIKGYPSRSTSVSSQDTSDKNKVSPTIYPKHKFDPVSTKPSLLNVKSSNDHEDDYLYEGSKETLDRQTKDAVSTAAPKTTTTAMSEPHRPVQNFENESVDREQSSISTGSKTVPSVPNKDPTLAFNGRVRSPVVSRLKGSRFPSRLYPVQHRRLGASTPDTSSASSQNSPAAESPFTSDRNRAASSNANVRLTSGSVSRPSHGLSAGESSSGNISPESRSPVMGSRLRSASTQGNGYKPSFGKGNFLLSARMCMLYL